MAYDLMLGREAGRSWSRGAAKEEPYGAGSWAEERALGAAGRKIPWVPIAAVAAGVGLLVILPSGKKKAHAGSYYHRGSGSWTEPTVRIPSESMGDLRKKDPIHAYGRHR